VEGRFRVELADPPGPPGGTPHKASQARHLGMQLTTSCYLLARARQVALMLAPMLWDHIIRVLYLQQVCSNACSVASMRAVTATAMLPGCSLASVLLRTQGLLLWCAGLLDPKLAASHHRTTLVADLSRWQVADRHAAAQRRSQWLVALTLTRINPLLLPSCCFAVHVMETWHYLHCY
jgi:hypothetical protein